LFVGLRPLSPSHSIPVRPPRFSLAIEGSTNKLGFVTFGFVGLAVLLCSSALARGARKVDAANSILGQNLPSRLSAVEQQLVTQIAGRQRTEQCLETSYKVTLILALSGKLFDAAYPILQCICDILNWDVGLFWEVDKSEGVLRCVQVWNRPDIQLTAFVRGSHRTVFPKGTGLPGRVWAEDRVVSVPDMRNAGLPRSSLASSLGLNSAIGFPIRNGVEFLGVMEFFLREIGPLDDATVQMMGSIGGQISQFIERREAEKVLDQQAVEQCAARSIQEGLLPKAMPQLARFEISGKAFLAQVVGGDCFDFFPLPWNDCWGVLIADACGHGMASALLVAETRAYLRALALICSDVGQMLTLTNSRLSSDISSDYFVTALLARLDHHTLSLDYSSAGHCSGFILDNEGQTRVVLDSTGCPLGIEQASEFPTSRSVQLRPGELVLLSTDGIIEAHSSGGRPFGVERMLDIVRARRHDPLNDILDSLFRTVRDFAHPSSPHDDMTAVLIRVKTGV